MPDSLGIRSIANVLDTKPRAILVVVGCAFCDDAYISIREDLEIPMSGDTEQHSVAMDGLCPLKGLSVTGT
jgi:predicted metallo-beta-lactamase superfamily hydrolase